MSYVKTEQIKSIKKLNELKKEYPLMDTQDVIDMLGRIKKDLEN
jgi:hypothetical protein